MENQSDAEQMRAAWQAMLCQSSAPHEWFMRDEVDAADREAQNRRRDIGAATGVSHRRDLRSSTRTEDRGWHVRPTEREVRGSGVARTG